MDRLHGVVIGLAAALTGCGDGISPHPAQGPASRPRWDVEVNDSAQSHGSCRGALNLPQAGNPGEDASELGRDRLEVNVTRVGSTVGVPWEGATFDESFPRMSDARAPSIDRLAVRADIDVAWRDVSKVLRIATERPFEWTRLRFILLDREGMHPWANAALDAEASGERSGSMPAARVAVRLGRRGESVRVATGGADFDLGPFEVYQVFCRWDPTERRRLAEVNAAWDRLEGTLLEARRGGALGVALDVEGEVPWAYVAQTLGIAHEAGLAHVEIAGLARALELRAPPPRWYLLPMEVFDDEPHLALGLGIGALLAAVAVGAGVLRRGPRRA